LRYPENTVLPVPAGASMGQKDSHFEQRAEPRFPLHFHASLKISRNGSTSLFGHMKNISMHGIMLNVAHPLPEYETVDITFHVPQLRDIVNTQGIVKWCRKKTESYSLGIRFLESTTFSIPFHQMCMAYDTIFQKTPKGLPPQNKHCSDNQIRHFHHELYCGLFFSIFEKDIYKDLMKSIFFIDVISFYIQSISDDLDIIENKILIKKYAQDALEKTLNLKKHSENIIYFLTKDINNEISELNSYTEETLDIDMILSECIDSFRISLDHIISPHQGKIKYTVYDVPRISGSKTEFMDSFKYLILFTYQCIFSRKARNIKIDLNTSKDFMFIDFINDGSQMLQDKIIEIEASSINNLQDYHYKDHKYIVWLWYTISIFQYSCPKLCIQSESGNNIIRFQLPLNSS
jgi:hypothetical protein